MKIQPINNNLSSASFGANIRFANQKNEVTMYSARAKKLMNKVKEMPDAEILIGYVKGKTQEDSFLTATNNQTGVTMRERVSDKDFSNIKSIGQSNTFSNLLEAILNPNYLVHNDFWYGEEQFEPAFNLNKSKRFVA